MALGVEGMRAGRVVLRATFLTLATVLFVASLTLVYQSMRSVMDIGGSCASGGPYVTARPCPDNVVWAMPLGIFGMMAASGLSLLSTFSQGGPRPYVFSVAEWQTSVHAKLAARGDARKPASSGAGPSGPRDPSRLWKFYFVQALTLVRVPLIFLLMPTTFRWATWGPVTEVVPGAGRVGTHRSPADLVRMARGNDPKATAPTAPVHYRSATPSGPYAALTPNPPTDADEEPTA